MRRIIIEEKMYILICESRIIKQWSYSSDQDALDDAKEESENRGKKVMAARWLKDIIEEREQ
jgi:hypothetical protein